MRNLSAVYLAVVIAAGILVATGLVLDWGLWYSDYLAYRGQTEAFLEGTLAVGADVRRIGWDEVWFAEKAQQPWGLGVPAWRLPFEAMARLAGQPAFPDRLALGAAWALVAFGILRLYLIPSKPVHPVAWLKERPERICVFALLVLFPPLLTMTRFRFVVYEEAAAYSFLAGVGLFAFTLWFYRRRTVPVFLGLALLAGVAPFVRPTLLAYSVASLLIALFLAWHIGWRWHRLVAGVVLFGLGCTLLFVSNAHRFGSGLEFGHATNLNTVDSMRYTSRFDHPMRSEPLHSAAAELGAGLFLIGNSFNGYGWYEQDFHVWQSSTHRWREYYFTTYDPTFALMLAGALGLAILRKVKGKESGGIGNRERGRAGDAGKREVGEAEGRGVWGGRLWSETDLMILWMLLAAVPIFVFYLRGPFLASRYLLDFGPAFAVGLSAFVFLAAESLRRRIGSGRRSVAIILIAFAGWWGWQVFTGDGAFPAGPVLRAEQVAARLNVAEPQTPFEGLPDSYVAGMEVDSRWPPFNGAGWDLETGQTKAAVTLFVPAVARLEIEVAPAEGGGELAPEDYEIIRAKVGLEFLRRSSIEVIPEGRRLVFEGPKRGVYRQGIQTCFLGFVAAETATDGDSPFQLLRVEWEEL